MPGSVNYAGWTLSWSIPSNWGGGLGKETNKLATTNSVIVVRICRNIYLGRPLQDSLRVRKGSTADARQAGMMQAHNAVASRSIATTPMASGSTACAP